MKTTIMNDTSINVNSELYFNEKLDLWLNNLTKDDVKKVIDKCLNINLSQINSPATIHTWDSVDPRLGKNSRFDQRISFGDDYCLIFELKVKTEATVGQLQKYLDYVRMFYKNGIVVLLSREKNANKKTGYDELIKRYNNLHFLTWEEFHVSINNLYESDAFESSKKNTEEFLYLLTLLTDIEQRSKKLVIQTAPPAIHVYEYISALKKVGRRSKDNYLFWPDRIAFWDELIEDICSHSHINSFVSFRFDFYEYIWRWLFHKKDIYVDIYTDKNYEYYYNYFINNVYPKRAGKTITTSFEIYNRFLLIRKDEVLETSKHYVFFRQVGKLWYIYIILKGDVSKNSVQYLNCFDLSFL